MSQLKIGSVTLDSNIILAPMAGVTDLPFRLLCREQGAGMVCTEMVSAKAIYYRNQNTEKLMEIHPDEGPVSLQLFGSDPCIMGEMAKRIEEKPFAVLDINMGCPVPKVVNNGEGSALMKNPVLAGKIIESVVKSIQKPVTVKIRRGFDEEHINAAEMARVAEESGASAVIIHGRTREQYYSGKADWNCIADVKQKVKIPVIGNGDVVDGISAKQLLDSTGCDGVMIGRASQGNPWIFREVRTYLETGKTADPPGMKEKKEIIYRHVALQKFYKGEHTAVREMRKHLSWYTAGMPHSAVFRQQINSVETMEELYRAMDSVFGKNC